MSNSKMTEVVAAAIVEDGKVFATQRGPGMQLPGMWEFPGGKIEKGESPRTALEREIREELLCVVKVGEEITITEHHYEFGTIRLRSFWATLTVGHPTLTEHQRSRWLAPDELFSVEWAPADVPAIEIVAEALER